MRTSVEPMTTDVLVVGGGGAACRAALEAEMAGATVILAVKRSFGDCECRPGNSC